jgi:hypothetical protein
MGATWLLEKLVTHDVSKPLKHRDKKVDIFLIGPQIWPHHPHKVKFEELEFWPWLVEMPFVGGFAKNVMERINCNIKENGDKGSPCFSPLPCAMGFPATPLIRTLEVDDVRRAATKYVGEAKVPQKIHQIVTSDCMDS